VDLSYFRDSVEAAVNKSADPAHVTIGGVSIAWGGFSHGLDQPLILRITDLAVAEAEGGAGMKIPRAEIALSARWLLIGRILPRAISLVGARLVLIRAEDGSVSFNLGDTAQPAGPSPLAGLLAVFGTPAENDRQPGIERLSQLSTVSIREATLRLEDRVWDMTWIAERADIDLSRRRGGGMDGQARLLLAMAKQKAVLTSHLSMAPAARSVHVEARLSQITPKSLSEAAPALAPLAALDAPLTLDAEADLRSDFTLGPVRLIARAGAGRINTDAGSTPIRRAELTVSGTPKQAMLEAGVVELQPFPGGPVSTLAASGPLTRQPGHSTARLRVTLDRVAFADLAALWPEDVASNPRQWITRNMTSGIARDGKVDLVLESSGDPANVTLTDATGTLEGDDISVVWLPTVPRVEQGKAHVVLMGPDKVEIDIRSARQKVSGGDPIAIPTGHVTVTGLASKDQVATIRCDVTGSIPSALALLKEPRLHILDRRPIDLRAPTGEVRMSLFVAVPLLRDLQIEDVTIRGTGNLNKTHLAGVVAGRDLDDGLLAFDVDTNHLALKGTARVAGIPANIETLMDFRAGPAAQVTQRHTLSARTTAAALAAAGLDAGDILTGDLGLNAAFNQYRSGDGEIVVEADLAQSVLTIAPLAWRKPAGGPAKASARLNLAKEKLTGVDRLTVDGPGFSLRGAITVFGARLDTLRLERAVLGRTDVRGTIRLPHAGPIGVDLTGATLDVSAKLLEKRPKRDPATPEPPGPSWSMRGRFDHVLLANGHATGPVAVTAEHDGTVFRGLMVAGKTSAGKPFSMQIGQGPAANGGHTVRRLAVTAEDAGNLLHALDLTETIRGGSLRLAGDFNDTTTDHTLTGTLELDDFRVARAPALGKLLQAVTLYGLVDALSGPGLSFSRLTAPFQFNEDAVVLSDARAFSPSLGLTAKGRIDRRSDQLDVSGTLVPAYVFNSLLGRIPVIGGLFSAEKGGGLFAMNYSLRGPADNPTVAANPLSALTPGILRGMFGLFDRPSAGQRPPLDRGPVGGNAPPP
jgi:hypothetical protein